MATSVRWSPIVCTTTGSTGSPRAAATRSVCSRANALARVAARNDIGLEIEELAQGVGQAIPAWRAGRVLQADGRVVQQLGEHAPCDGLDRLTLLGIEAFQATPVALQLGDPQ